MKQARYGSAKRIRPAEVDSPSAIITDRLLIEVDVVGHNQIEPAVPVIIEKTGGQGPLRVVESGFSCDFGEGLAPTIQEKSNSTEFGHQKIWPSVVVHVTDNRSHTVARNFQAR